MIKENQLVCFGDDRGSLVSLESDRNVPFAIKRCYYIFGTTPGVRRGFHAHRELKQLLICTSGSCKIFLDDGCSTQDVELNNPLTGLLVTGLVWREMYDFSDDCVLMVLADEYYDEADYIRNYKEFLSLARTSA